MFIVCYCMFYFSHFFQEFGACLQDVKGHLSRERFSKTFAKFTHINLVGCRHRQSRQWSKAASCQRKKRGFWAGRHRGYQLVAPSSMRYHLLHPVPLATAATLKLRQKESSLKQTCVSEVCLPLSASAFPHSW